MPDSFTHKFNAENAIALAEYTPRNYNTFILGCNGPDLLFFYKMYTPFKKHNLSKLGGIMHNEHTGLFLQNLFRFAQTDAQKDYCLGFLCHYSLDSTIHPYVNYITSAYGSAYNIANGHGYFESALDSLISFRQNNSYAADPQEYFPEVKKMHLEQLAMLLKQAVDETYPAIIYAKSEYLQAFKDFKFIKKLLYSPKKHKFFVAKIAEMLLGFPPGFILCHMQPNYTEVKLPSIWRNNAIGFFSTTSFEDLLERADYLSCDYIKTGLLYFNGQYSLTDLLEDIGNKSYETGITVNTL